MFFSLSTSKTFGPFLIKCITINYLRYSVRVCRFCISTHIDHCNVQMHFVMHFENRIFLFFVFKQACHYPLVTNNKIVIVKGYNFMYCVIIFYNLG